MALCGLIMCTKSLPLLLLVWGMCPIRWVGCTAEEVGKGASSWGAPHGLVVWCGAVVGGGVGHALATYGGGSWRWYTYGGVAVGAVLGYWLGGRDAGARRQEEAGAGWAGGYEAVWWVGASLVTSFWLLWCTGMLTLQGPVLLWSMGVAALGLVALRMQGLGAGSAVDEVLEVGDDGLVPLPMVAHLFPQHEVASSEPVADMQVALMLDIVLLLLLLMGMYRGFSSGFVAQIFSSMTVFLFLISGMRFFKYVLAMTRYWWPHLSHSLPFVSFLFFCFGSLLLLMLLEKMSSYLTRLTFLGYLDSLLGACLGGGQMALFISIFINTASSLGLGLAEHHTVHMHLYEPIRLVAPRLLEGVRTFSPSGAHFFTETEQKLRAMLHPS